ncbi:hypothetical protein [Nocardia sp. NPDC057030]|uniref:hypothetical protein n=1 Tax=unclassified Nocardia TaxID=2637762 RepID=UPI003627C50B
MGDYFERIVDVEVPAAEAGALAERVVDWLVSRRLLSREMSAEGMYSLDVAEGHLPGAEWRQITREWGDWIPGPVAVIIGRADHFGGQGAIEPDSAGCPRCGARTVIIDYPQQWEADPEVWRPFRDAVAAWKRTGTGVVKCASCDTESPVTEWQWPAEFALGALAFDFWGWPPLTDEFIADLAKQLGHNIDHQSGKF